MDSTWWKPRSYRCPCTDTAERLFRDSGAWRGHRMIGGGRSCVRNVLYMTALVAILHNSVVKATNQRLVHRSRPLHPSAPHHSQRDHQDKIRVAKRLTKKTVTLTPDFLPLSHLLSAIAHHDCFAQRARKATGRVALATWGLHAPSRCIAGPSILADRTMCTQSR